MKILLILLLGAVALAAGPPKTVRKPAALRIAYQPAAQHATRAVLATVERNFDRLVEQIDVTDPLFVLGNTRGIYLEGYGAVFTAEVNLVGNAVLSPFRTFSPADLAKLREKKLQRLPIMKQYMRTALVTAAATLPTLPSEENIVLGVSFFYFRGENQEGLPGQIVMIASKKALLDAAKTNPAALETAIRVQEY